MEQSKLPLESYVAQVCVFKFANQNFAIENCTYF